MRTTGAGASSIGHVFSTDPELRLPDRPRLLPEVTVLPFGPDGLLFAGTREPQVIRGRSARSLLPRLLPALTGRDTLEQLAGRLSGLPADSVRHTIALLYSRGLLEQGVPPSLPSTLADLAAFLGRFLDVTRVNASRGEALDRLAAAHLVIDASPEVGRILARALAGSGIGSVRVLDEPRLGSDDATLAIVISSDRHPVARRGLRTARARGVPALRAHLGGDHVHIGPLFLPDDSPCYDCVCKLEPPPPRSSGVAAPPFWLAVVSLHAFVLASRIGNPRLYRTLQIYRKTSHGWLRRERIVGGLPGCTSCGLGPHVPATRDRSPALHQGRPGDRMATHEERGDREHVTDEQPSRATCGSGRRQQDFHHGLPDPHANRAWLLHAGVGLPPADLRSPRDHQNHYSVANISLTRKVPAPTVGATRVPLPDAGPLDCPPPWMTEPHAAGGLNIATLATLLRYAAGYQEGTTGSRRIAPTGGGLGSPELSVAANRIEGLDAGTYRYHAPDHVLERLPAVSPALIAAGLGIQPGDAPGYLIGAGDLDRVRRKYHDFAYRLVYLDAGVTLWYLHEVGEAVGIDRRYLGELHDTAVADMLCLPVGRHGATVTFGMAIRPRRPAGVAGRVADPDPLDALARATACPAGTLADTPQGGQRLGTHALRQPSRHHGLGSILRARRSSRVYTDRTLSEDDVETVVRCVLEANEQLEHSGMSALDLRVWLLLRTATSRVGSGVYGIEPAVPHRLVERRRGLGQEELRQCLVQTGLAAAPAMLVVTGNFEIATARHGARAYRELLLHAGATIARGLLAATSRGLGACATAGLVERAACKLLGTDGYRTCPLFAMVLGHPPSRALDG